MSPPLSQEPEHHEHHIKLVDNKSTKRHVIDAVIDFMGGVAGGTASVYIGQPLDTVKVKMQSFPSLYTNGYYCFKTTFQKEGIYRGLYAGTLPSLAAQIGENSILFLAYGQCQKLTTKLTNKGKISDLNALENALSGSMAAFFSSFALCPTELIKCKLQAMREMSSIAASEAAKTAGAAGKSAADRTVKTTTAATNLKHIGPWQLTRQILQQEGIQGMFRGLVPTFYREIPGYFCFFGGYELTKVLLTPKGHDKDALGPAKTMICGGVGGVALWIAIFPFDVIKSRVQVGTNVNDVSLSFVSMIKKIAREEGIRALYKGLGPTILRTFPATGSLFLAYESTKKYLGRTADYIGIG